MESCCSSGGSHPWEAEPCVPVVTWDKKTVSLMYDEIFSKFSEKYFYTVLTCLMLVLILTESLCSLFSRSSLLLFISTLTSSLISLLSSTETPDPLLSSKLLSWSPSCSTVFSIPEFKDLGFLCFLLKKMQTLTSFRFLFPIYTLRDQF